MFHHPAWALGSLISDPPAAGTVTTKSTGGFYRSDVSPCILWPVKSNLILEQNFVGGNTRPRKCFSIVKTKFYHIWSQNQYTQPPNYLVLCYTIVQAFIKNWQLLSICCLNITNCNPPFINQRSCSVVNKIFHTSFPYGWQS